MECNFVIDIATPRPTAPPETPVLAIIGMEPIEGPKGFEFKFETADAAYIRQAGNTLLKVADRMDACPANEKFKGTDGDGITEAGKAAGVPTTSPIEASTKKE